MFSHVSDLTWEQFIYPRGGKSEKTINAYVDALAIGAQFPPIKIQRVFNYAGGNETTEATIILDGIHRWFAFMEKEIKELPAVEWKDKPLDYEKNKAALLLESAECNISHVDRLSPRDKKRIAREIATSDPACPPPARNASILHELALPFVLMNIMKRCIWPLLMHGRRVALTQTIQSDRSRLSLRRGGRECKWTESALAEKLGVIQQTVNTWISDIRARQKAGRNTVILRLSRLACPPFFWRGWPPFFWRGWIQEMIAKVVRLDRSVISRNVQNTKISHMHNHPIQKKSMKNFLKADPQKIKRNDQDAIPECRLASSSASSP